MTFGEGGGGEGLARAQGDLVRLRGEPPRRPRRDYVIVFAVVFGAAILLPLLLLAILG